MNPYDVLGVAKEATADEIRVAFRRAASAAHPDRQGGDGERMAQVNEAYAVLADPERRKRFDESGETAAQPPLDAEAIGALADIFKQAIEQDEQGILEFARAMTRNTRQQIMGSQARAAAKRDSLTKKRQRVRVQGEVANIVHAIIDAQIGAIAKQLAALDRALLVADAVEKLLDAYEEDPLAPQWRPMFSGFGTAATWGA